MNYIGLEYYCSKLYANGVNSIKFNILISIEKAYYQGESLDILLSNIKGLIGKNRQLQNFDNTLKVETIELDVGDVLNRHNWYYRYSLEYIQKNNLDSENDIPEDIKKELAEKAYLKGEKQGQEWFINNLDAINQLIPEGHKISKDFKLNDDISVLYEGDENNPKIQYICYKHWLNHPKYKSVEKALNEVCKTENSLIERAFKYETDYFDRLYSKKGGVILNKELFSKNSYNYLFDETIPYIIKHYEANNIIEFYINSVEAKATSTFRGRKAQNDPIIQQYLQGPLKGADKRKFVSVKMVEENS